LCSWGWSALPAIPLLPLIDIETPDGGEHPLRVDLTGHKPSAALWLLPRVRAGVHTLPFKVAFVGCSGRRQPAAAGDAGVLVGRAERLSDALYGWPAPLPHRQAPEGGLASQYWCDFSINQIEDSALH